MVYAFPHRTTKAAGAIRIYKSNYLRSDGFSPAKAHEMANRADTCTTQFCDRHDDVASLGEYATEGF
jgi:hypothetical protein